jgi:hypothetical protein
VDILVIPVLMFRLVCDSEGPAPADDVSGEDKEPGEEKSTVVDNRENTSTPVADVATTITHREEKKEPQTTIKTLLPVIRSPSHAQEISATERSAFSLFIFCDTFPEG